MNLLGKCSQKLDMLDLAVNQLDEAAGEILTMDATKKEITYNLAWFTRRWATPKILSPA